MIKDRCVNSNLVTLYAFNIPVENQWFTSNGPIGITVCPAIINSLQPFFSAGMINDDVITNLKRGRILNFEGM